MITITNSTLRSSDFKETILKIARCNKLPSKVAYKFSRVLRVIDTEGLRAHNEWLKLMSDKVVKDESGRFTRTEDNSDFVFLPGVDPTEAKESMVEWGKQEIEIRGQVAWDKFSLEDLSGAGLSPSDILILDGFIKDPEEEATDGSGDHKPVLRSI